MDLTNIDRLSVNGKRVVCISSDHYPGQYIWNETYKVNFIDAAEFGSGEISSVTLTYGIDDGFPGLDYHSPHPNYVFDGWEPDIPVGERISDDVTLVAVYTSDGGRTIVTFVGDQAPRGYSPNASGGMTKEVLIAGGIRPNGDIPTITTWNNLSVQILSVQFGDDVSSIGNNILYQCPTLSSIAFQNGVSSIGNYAFGKCVNLGGKVVFPESLLEIGQNAFYGCSSLTGVFIPSSLSSFKQYSFFNCSSLVKTEVNDVGSWFNKSFGNREANPVYYSQNLYLGDEPVTEISIPDNINTVGKYLLYNCKTISSVYVPESVAGFDTLAFNECTGLKRVDIADGVDWGMLAFINKYSNPLYYARYLYRNGEPVTYASTDNRFAF